MASTDLHVPVDGEPVDFTKPFTELPKVAEVLGISPWQAYRLAREGRLPLPVVKLGRAYRVPTKALARLIEGDAP